MISPTSLIKFLSLTILIAFVSVSAYATDPWKRSSIAVSGNEEAIVDGDSDELKEDDEDLSDGKFVIYLTEESAIYTIVLESASEDAMYPKLTINNAIEVNSGNASFNQELELDRYDNLKLYYGEFNPTPCTISGNVKNNQKTELSPAKNSLESPEFSIVIHGGAGSIERENMTAEREAAYRQKLEEAFTGN